MSSGRWPGSTARWLLLTIGPQRAAPTLRAALADAMRDGLVSGGTWPPWSSRPRPIVQRCGHSLRMRSRGWSSRRRDDPFGPLFALAVASGLRLGELVGLSWDDVDLEARSLTVKRAAFLRDDGTYDFGQPQTKRSRRTPSCCPPSA